MTRSMTAAATAALCAILLVTAHTSTSAQGKTPAKVASAKAAPAKAAPAKAAPVVPAGSITLTGCLEADGRKYMLTDLEGAQAPKGRNWKTGFVTKTAKDVEVTPSSSVKLGDHIGRKVSVVGVRNDDTHLQARSIKQLAASCS